MTRFQLKMRCTSCGMRFKRVVSAEDELHLAEMPDPPCPHCSVVQRRIGMDVAAGKAPAALGALATRARDYTEALVTEDHGMTDIRDNVREGESSVPKLPPAQQAKVDNFFPKMGRRAAPGLMGMAPRQVLQAAVGGRFMTPDTVNPIATHHAKHAQRDKPPVQIVAGDGVRKGA